MGKEARTGGLAGKRPEMARKAIFSEGRGLRVRKYGPDASRGRSRLRTGARKVGGEKEATYGLARSLPLRACGARPSAAQVGHEENRGFKKGKRPGRA